MHLHGEQPNNVTLPATVERVAGYRGIGLGTIASPRRVIIDGYKGKASDFPAWIDGLRAGGWAVRMEHDLSFDGFTIQADPPALRELTPTTTG